MAGSFSKKQYATIADKGIGNEFVERTVSGGLEPLFFLSVKSSFHVSSLLHFCDNRLYGLIVWWETLILCCFTRVKVWFPNFGWIKENPSTHRLDGLHRQYGYSLINYSITIGLYLGTKAFITIQPMR